MSPTPSGWVPWDQVVLVDKAVDFFSEQIRVQNRDSIRDLRFPLRFASENAFQISGVATKTMDFSSGCNLEFKKGLHAVWVLLTSLGLNWWARPTLQNWWATEPGPVHFSV
jgi:hypothetical protein